jgi:hypothetical protein
MIQSNGQEQAWTYLAKKVNIALGRLLALVCVQPVEPQERLPIYIRLHGQLLAVNLEGGISGMRDTVK